MQLTTLKFTPWTSIECVHVCSMLHVVSGPGVVAGLHVASCESDLLANGCKQKVLPESKEEQGQCYQHISVYLDLLQKILLDCQQWGKTTVHYKLGKVAPATAEQIAESADPELRAANSQAHSS